MEFTINSTISVETTPTGVAVLSLNRPEQWNLSMICCVIWKAFKTRLFWKDPLGQC